MNDVPDGESMIREFQALGVEVPPKLLSEAELEKAKHKRDSLMEDLDSVLDYGFYDYDIKFRVEGMSHEQFKEDLVALILTTRCLEYDIKVTPKFNPVRFDNQPF